MASDYLKLYEDYLREEKHASENTLSSYLRDLRQFSEHLAAQRVTDLRKVKTAATMVCICLILLGIPQWLNDVCQGVILVTTVYSGIEYFAKNADVFKEVK